MEITQMSKSGLIKGEFLNIYYFEDDTIVFESNEGFDVENVNNIKSDYYYINKVKKQTIYKKQSRRQL
jgi:hypothetical protein